MLSDIEISNNAKLLHIKEIASKIGISEEDLDYYGKYKAKISDSVYKKIKNNKSGKLILVTAINPTPAGEGKTTVTIGLGQALNKLNKKCIMTLREPSLGPVMGLKGGATGGGYSQVVPMDDINLHFTGDIHALTSANNLISAVIDNHIFNGNELDIDLNNITWKRAMDVNDRTLRNVTVGKGEGNGTEREDGFVITVASELMAILCLSKDLDDLKNRVAEIIIGYNTKGNPIKVSDLKITGAITVLLKDAIKPNLVQTVENVPCIIHGGPFANIAHGCNSLVATNLALKLADYVVTEAGFGADLGAEKFLDIKCRIGGLKPDVVVIVATVRSLKYNGGVKKEELTIPNLEALKNGIVNLEKHIENIKKYNLPVVVAINKFFSDTDEEINYIKEICRKNDVGYAISEVFAKGGDGGIELAKNLLEIIDKQPSNYKPLYNEELPIKEKIKTIAKEIYGARDVVYTQEAEKQIEMLEDLGLDKVPICIAKTQYSLSDDASKLGKPTNFDITVREIKISNGAGFIVAITGKVLTMPGLPKVPAAEKIDISSEGVIEGLF